MFILKLALKRLLSAWRFIWSCIRSMFCCRKRDYCDESLLPFVADRENLPENISVTTGNVGEQWNSWSDEPFSNVAQKIEEYRKKKMETSNLIEVQPDFFNDMEPQVKQPRKAFIGKEERNNAKQSLFSFNEINITPQMPLGELGEINDVNDEEMDSWDTGIDVENIDSVLREQLKEERRQKNVARRLEHEKKFQGKRKTLANA